MFFSSLLEDIFEDFLLLLLFFLDRLSFFNAIFIFYKNARNTNHPFSKLSHMESMSLLEFKSASMFGRFFIMFPSSLSSDSVDTLPSNVMSASSSVF